MFKNYLPPSFTLSFPTSGSSSTSTPIDHFALLYIACKNNVLDSQICSSKNPSCSCCTNQTHCLCHICQCHGVHSYECSSMTCNELVFNS